MGKFASNLAGLLIGFMNKGLVKNLLIITLSVLLVFVQLFFPFNYYSSASRNPASTFQVGIHYVYEQDPLEQIPCEIERIYDLGFQVIRISLECNPLVYDDLQNQKTDVFFSETNSYGLATALIIPNDDQDGKVDYYLDRWGSNLEYIQVMNEPESSSSWDIGALFSDDEILSKFNKTYANVASRNLQAQLYTNFGVGYFLRSNLPTEISKRLDFVGLDIFMDSFLVLSPHFIENLKQITGKEVVITEFGMSTSDDTAQSNYIINGLNLFKSMGLKGSWLVYWNSEFDNYGIRGRPAEKAVGDWIARNA